jgi:hypothetical protein
LSAISDSARNARANSPGSGAADNSSGIISVFMAFFCHSFDMAVAMARDVNPLKSELITLSLNAQTVWYLDRLVETGLFGNNRTEAARVAIYDHCKLLVAERKLEMAPPLPGKLVAMTE